MSALNTSLYASLASSEAARILAPQLKGQEDIVAAQLRATMNAEPGTTVTARYQFKVGADGTYHPTETQITTEAENVGNATDEQGQKRPGQFLRQQQRNGTARFSDFLPTRPTLSPSDEAALFSVDGNTPGSLQVSGEEQPAAQAAASAVITGEAQEEDGTAIDVEILPPASQAANDNGTPSLAARAQASVANLYARNNDIVYNTSPVSELAA